ncbi:hypothetical protein PSAB6_580042 [Paraburkholderia sabiae]|nr:hypothetical protein PSAB6_580042 [Paraburkholderia sabiae]
MSRIGCAGRLSFFLQFILGCIVKVDESKVVMQRRELPDRRSFVGTIKISRFRMAHSRLEPIWRRPLSIVWHPAETRTTSRLRVEKR